MPVDSPHTLVKKYQRTWEEIDHVLDGPIAVKSQEFAERYLPPLPGMERYTGDQSPDNSRKVNRYNGYLRRAVLLSYARPLLNRLLGMVFRKPPVFTVPKPIEDQLRDLTLSGITEEGFSKLVMRQNLTAGFGGILIDYSQEKRRPYQRLYSALSIRNWREIDEDGTKIPTEVRLLESSKRPLQRDEWVDIDVPQCRVIRLTLEPEGDDYPHGHCEHQLYQKDIDENGNEKPGWLMVDDPVVPKRNGQPLNFIPFVPFTPYGVNFDLDRPPFADLTELILAHYLNSADHEQAMHFEAAGTVLFGAGFQSDEQDQLQTVGSGSLVFSTNPSAKLEYIQAAGVGESLDLAMQRKEGWMAIAMGRLLLQQQKNVAESGRSQEMQFAGDDANLQQVVGTTAMALERAMQMQTWWSGSAKTIEEASLRGTEKLVNVELNDQYIVGKILPEDIAKLGAEVAAGRMTLEQYFHQVFVIGEMGLPSQTFEEWQQQLDDDRKRSREVQRQYGLPPRPAAPGIGALAAARAKKAAMLDEQQQTDQPVDQAAGA